MKLRTPLITQTLFLVALAALLPDRLALAEQDRTPVVRPRPPPPRPAPAPPASGSCVGRWVGWGRGSSGLPWSIDMVVTATAGASCGTIEYPSLGCGGFLQRCSMVNGEAHITERYTHNPGTCAPAGTIVARCTGDVMRWRWDGQETVFSLLRRR